MQLARIRCGLASFGVRAALFAVCAVWQPLAGQAQVSPEMIEARFKAADKNGDGRLTLEEAQAGMPRIAKVFDQIDVDKKGFVTLEQIQAFVAKYLQ